MREMKTIPNFPDYSITKDGRIWSKPRKDSSSHIQGGIWIKPRKYSRHKYLYVILYANTRKHTCKIHRLVLETYVGLCPEGMECRHLDGNPANNKLENLCWGTHAENMQDRILHGMGSRGEKHKEAKLTEQQVRQIIYIHRTKLFTQEEIANQYDISRTIISRIVNKKLWGHLWAA